jgi:hypothetical protein
MDSIETNRLCDMAALCIFFWAFNITRRNSVMSVTASGGVRGSSRRLGGWALKIVAAAAFFVTEAAKLTCVMNS